MPKIPIEIIEKKVAWYALFSKRRLGLYKKASELVRECDIDLGIFISSQTGKPYSVVHPTANVVIDHFICPTTIDLGAQFDAVEARNNVIQMNDRLNDFDAREKAAKKIIRMMDWMNEARVRGWWRPWTSSVLRKRPSSKNG